MMVKVAAPAKINLTLDVTGRLENGYHTVEMVMQTVDLTDVLEISPADTLHITVGDADLCVDESNTIWKATYLYSEAIGVQPQFSVALQKNIPMQAGMAGGSADAAGVLVGLNAMFDHRLTTAQLCELGAKVGADVPFCILGGTMLATGIGTHLETLPPLSCGYILTAKPFCGVSTAAAYAAIDGEPYPAVRYAGEMINALSLGDLSAVGRGMHNRFAEVLRLPEVEQLVALLQESGALGACMTGSGSAVIGLFADELTAKQAVDRVRSLCEQVNICRPWQGGPKVFV